MEEPVTDGHAGNRALMRRMVAFLACEAGIGQFRPQAVNDQAGRMGATTSRSA
jgi:hypothetical protein